MRLGTISKGLEKGHKAGKGKGVLQSPQSGLCKKDALDQAGVTKQQAHRYERIAAIPLKEFETYIASQRAKNEAVSLRELWTPARTASVSPGNS